MIYKFIDNNGSEITVNSLSSLQALVESETIKEDTKIKAGLRGKWTTASKINELFFPNGTVISPDGKILIVGETYAARLTAFDINLDATLSNRRIWADLSKIRENYFPVPDGICLDEEGAIWVASPTTNEVIRVEEGGKILETITVKNNAYACMLGGEDRKTLFICTSNGTDEKSCKEDRGGCIETAEVDIAGCGHP